MPSKRSGSCRVKLNPKFPQPPALGGFRSRFSGFTCVSEWKLSLGPAAVVTWRVGKSEHPRELAEDCLGANHCVWIRPERGSWAVDWPGGRGRVQVDVEVGNPCESYLCIHGPMLLNQLLPKPFPTSSPLPALLPLISFPPSSQSLHCLSPRGASCFSRPQPSFQVSSAF